MNDRQNTAADTASPLDREIELLIQPGLKANAWRSDFEAFRLQRLWDEQYHARRVHMMHREWRRLRRRHPVLDLGTGRAGLAVALTRQGYRVVAADMRRRCCLQARLRGHRYDLDVPAVQGLGEELPFADRSFGAVICRDVLEHCHSPGRVLSEIRRVLRPNGSCFVTVINRWCWVDPHYHLAGLSFLPRRLAIRYVDLRGRTKESIRDRQTLVDMHYYTYGEFVRWAVDFGFEVRDLHAERLAHFRKRGARNRLRWILGHVFRPLSLQSTHFELLLSKPKRESRGRAR